MNGKNFPKIPLKKMRELTYKQIRDLHRLGWSWGEISELGFSKTTISKALNGRLKERKLRLNEINKKHKQ